MACGPARPAHTQGSPVPDSEEGGGAISSELLDAAAVSAVDAAAVDAGTPREDAEAAEEPCSIAGARALVLYGGAIDEAHPYAARARRVLREHRIAFDAVTAGQRAQYEAEGKGRYGAILIADYDAYLELSIEERARLDGYARRCDAGMYFLHVPAGSVVNGGEVLTGVAETLSSVRVDADSGVLDLTRDGGELQGALARGRLFDIVARNDNYRPVARATQEGEDKPFLLADFGAHDGIRRVLNGWDFDDHFLNDLLLIDALTWLSPVELGVLRERYFGVDIDDIFMPNYHADSARRSVKMQAVDVDELIATQTRISAQIGSEFRFVLGFNSAFYGAQYGDPEYFDDAAGDAALVAHRDAFHWFDHLERHTVVKQQPFEELAGYMREARAWAEETGVLERIGRYAVTPSHSGISQRYTPLYEAWREIWDVRYSSDTSGAGDGFEYMGVLVAPRSRAGIWSGQYAFAEVPRATLEKMARGGSVYREVVSRPVSIFMTHQSNYARDRLGNHLFEELVAFFARWTRYQLRSAAPEQLVDKHFEHSPIPFQG